MLNQKDIDELQQMIQAGEKPELYYVAHCIETRENVIDEAHFKSISRFKVLKIKISSIVNAYFEVLNYQENPDNYHVEEEIEVYDVPDDKLYFHYFTVPNNEATYIKPFNARYPSIIYGVKRIIKDLNGNVLKEFNDPSPVKHIYTNKLEYGDLNSQDVEQAYKDGKLDWKYIPGKYTSDGIDFKYLTTDWYIIECDNFPRTEKILINVKTKSSYFRNRIDAFEFLKECES